MFVALHLEKIQVVGSPPSEEDPGCWRPPPHLEKIQVVGSPHLLAGEDPDCWQPPPPSWRRSKLLVSSHLEKILHCSRAPSPLAFSDAFSEITSYATICGQVYPSRGARPKERTCQAACFVPFSPSPPPAVAPLPPPPPPPPLVS